MSKLLIIVISFICFPPFLWANDIFLIAGQSVGGEHPTSDVRVYRWQERDAKLKLEDKVAFPSVGIGGIYELGMNHDRRLFVAVGGWSPALNKAPMTVFKFHKGKVIKQPHMLDLNRFFEFYFHKSGKIAVQLDGPGGEWFLIDPEVTGGERKLIANKNLYVDDLLSSNVFTQSGADGMFPGFMTDVYGNIVTHWIRNAAPDFSLKSIPNDFFNHVDGFLQIINNSENMMVMGGFGIKERKQEQPIVIWDKIKDQWTYNWIPARMPNLALVTKQYVAFQVFKGKVRPSNQPQTGDFIFYNIAKNDMFKAPIGQDSEVFDIDDEGWVLYRAGDTLYKAQIQKDHLSTPIKLATDPALLRVHWGLWAEDKL